MRKEAKLIALWIYFMAMASILMGVFSRDYFLLFIGLGSTAMMIPWFICLLDILKTETANKVLWVLFLLFMGTVAVPVYLLTNQRLSK